MSARRKTVLANPVLLTVVTLVVGTILVLLANALLLPHLPEGWSSPLVAIAAGLGVAITVIGGTLGTIAGIQQLGDRRKPATIEEVRQAVEEIVPKQGAPSRVQEAPYTPPPLPAASALPDPGPLSPGSRLPFARNALFTGRHGVLLALARTLLHGPTGAAIIAQAVTGMGGTGKTQLAVEFAYRYGRFFRGIHWLDARDPALLAAEIAACGEAMDLPRWPKEQPDQLTCTLAAWREGGLRLVILDNIEDIAAIREWLPSLAVGTIRLLLTTRRSDWPRDLGLAILPLAAFSPEESHAFLRRTLPESRASDADLDALAERLGHLPLALQLASRFLEARLRLSVHDYLDQIEAVLDHPSMQAWRVDLGDATGHELDLRKTFAQSWRAVTSEAAQRIFLVCGYCAPGQPIPCALLEQASGLERDPCDEATSLLSSLGLLAIDDPVAGPTIHPLLAEFARSLDRTGSGTAFEPLPSLTTALAHLSAEAKETGIPAHFYPLRTHLEAALAAADAAGAGDAAALWRNLGQHLETVADHQGARASLERALAIDERVCGPDHPEVAADLSQLGQVLQVLGDLDGARSALERALAIDEQAFGPDHPRVALDASCLGILKRETGDLAGARAAHERALAIDERAFGPDHPRVGSDMNNLGIVLYLLSDLTESRAALERALAIREHALGPDHPAVGEDLNALGIAQRGLGDLAAARASYERALAIDERAFGPDHPEVAASLSNLGQVLQEMGDLAGSRGAFERALAIVERVYGPNHPEVALRVNNLGFLLRDTGDLAGARACYERALACYLAAYGPEHPSVALELNNLCDVLRRMGDLAGARADIERALAIDERALGPDHLDVAIDVKNLGLVLSDMGDLAGARAAFEHALTTFERVLPPDHPRLRLVREELASLPREGT